MKLQTKLISGARISVYSAEYVLCTIYVQIKYHLNNVYEIFLRDSFRLKHPREVINRKLKIII